MSRRLHIVLAFSLAVAALAACGGSEPTAAPNERPPSTAAATSGPASTATTPLDGSWRLELTEAEITTTLAAAGYAGVAEEFFAAEDIEGAITQVLTIEADRFAFAYQSGAQPWHVGWRGPAEIIGDVVTLKDELSTGEDTLRWTVTGDELTFEIVDTVDEVLKGLPNEVYLVAYLMSAPFQRTDCIPTETDCEN